jgi:anhydro-N-acetylmuramic acid kinase
LNKNSYSVIGVMSGTSLDGIDLAHCDFSISEDGIWNHTFRETETVPYPGNWKLRLKKGMHLSEHRLKILDREYTDYLSQVILEFFSRRSIGRIDAICSHGHTILHQPEKGITLQIGNRSELAQITKNRVVCDFRVQDVQLGGQGAPLVPIGDQILFSEYDYCLNLGGFANISYHLSGLRIAYDVCPVNIILNHYVKRQGVEYDDGGKQAAQGEINKGLLDTLNDLEYYSRTPPKSLGLEWVISNIFQLTDGLNIETRDILRTFIEHIAMKLSSEIQLGSTVLITGGGAYNSFLIRRLEALSGARLVIPNKQLIDHKEALIFGLLGVLRIRGENNCLASVTGAKKDHSSGLVFYP